MAIIRSNRQTNYTVIDNRVFADHQLSHYGKFPQWGNPTKGKSRRINKY